MRISRPFRKDNSGVAAIEFALMLPLLVLLFLGCAEGSQYIYANQKLKSSTYNILNLVNMQENVSVAQLQAIAGVISEVSRPVNVDLSTAKVIVTAMQRDLANKNNSQFKKAYVHWQEEFGASGLGESQFAYASGGSKEDNALPESALNGFSFAEGDQIIAVEIFAKYDPLIESEVTDSLLGTDRSMMYFLASARPRKGAFQFKPDEIR
ncbi:MAG: TadE/TadG family type IV pilus assembly protein [Hyphomicrobiales bacterium]